ncbi:LutC/YkgG family protein [Parafilimonas sp.]|uniref:LutC/YkgG family protein n=1 Tax=Parafilimonas sp. TaxID=1969739 RepID=UPI0039E4925D
MKTTSSRENILKKIKQALAKPVPAPFEAAEQTPVFFSGKNDEPELLFAENFAALQGRFSFCSDEAELVQQLQTLFGTRQWAKLFVNEDRIKELFARHNVKLPFSPSLADCDASLTSCECLIARTGSLLLSSAQTGRTSSVYAPVHVCIAYMDQLVFDLKDGLEFIKQKYATGIPSLITFASGPSRTADIEKTLVTGVHGPKEVFCFLVEKRA